MRFLCFFKKNFLKLVLLGGTLLSLSASHPYYLSVTELKYNREEKTVEGSVKLFVNDLESALKKLGNPGADLINTKDKAATEKMIAAYLRKRLQVFVNGKALTLSVVGFEQEQESFWIFVRSSSCPTPRQVNIENSLLYDFLKEQMNIVHFEVQGKSQSMKVTNPERHVSFSF